MHVASSHSHRVIKTEKDLKESYILTEELQIGVGERPRGQRDRNRDGLWERESCDGD